MIIYLATNKVNGMKYVGKTIYALTVRRKQHLRSNTYFGNALRKYKEDFSWEVLEEVNSLDELNDREIFWINELDTLGSKGYNLNCGGSNNGGWTLSNRQKEEMSLRFKGKVLSQETKDKISRALKGRVYSDQRKLEMRWAAMEARDRKLTLAGR